MHDIKIDNKNNNFEKEFEGRLYVSFSLNGKDLIPDEITSKLRIKPNYSFKRGDIKINKKGEKHVRKQGCWDIDSDNKDLPPNDIIAHLEWLLGILEPVEKELNELLVNKNIQARASCFWIVPDGRINIEVEPKLIARLAQLNIKIWFDIYCSH